MKAKIAYMYKTHDLRIEEINLPNLKSNQVLIKIGACGICGSDVECYEGLSGEGRYDLGPYTPGHEWAGKIVEIGSNVTTVQVGNKVTGDCVLKCGICSNCKDGLMPSACMSMREIGFRPDSPGGMGEYMILEEEYVHKIPDDWSYIKGSWIENFSVGYFGIWGNGGYVDASDDVIIVGGGPIGLSTAMVAKTSNAKVILIEPLENRRDIALKYGADFAIDPSDGKVKENILKITNGKGGSVIIEASGNDKGIASCFDIAGHSARLRFIGHSVGRMVPSELGLTIWKTLNMTGSGGTKDFLQRTIKFMSRMSSDYDFEALCTHFFPFEKLNEAMDIAVSQKANAMKVMLTF